MTGRTARAAAGPNGQLDSLSTWLDQSFNYKLTGEEIATAINAGIDMIMVPDDFLAELRQADFPVELVERHCPRTRAFDPRDTGELREEQMRSGKQQVEKQARNHDRRLIPE